MALIAIISDVHGDVHALRDALAQIDPLGCRRIVCAGDLVDYGCFPEETIGLMIERQIPCVRGNHDRWALGHGRTDSPLMADGQQHDATGWDLSERALTYLESLPKTLRFVEDGVRFHVCHASPKSDMDGIYSDNTPSDTTLKGWLDDYQADVLIVGHTHMPFARKVGRRRLVVNPGAVLRDPATPLEAPMILDAKTGKFVKGTLVLGTFGVFDTERLSFAMRTVARGDVLERPTVR
jgi:putative phosphoesterase